MGTIALILFCIVAAAISAAAIRGLRAIENARSVASRHSTKVARTTVARRTVNGEKEKSFPYFA
jgi:hypothetical protein